MSELGDALDTAEGDIERLEKRVRDLAEAKLWLEKRVKELEEETTRAESTSAYFRTRFQEVSAERDALNDRLRAILAEDETIEARVKELEAKRVDVAAGTLPELRGLRGDNYDLMHERAILRARVAELERKLKQARTAVQVLMSLVEWEEDGK